VLVAGGRYMVVLAARSCHRLGPDCCDFEIPREMRRTSSSLVEGAADGEGRRRHTWAGVADGGRRGMPGTEWAGMETCVFFDFRIRNLVKNCNCKSTLIK
jgi:hypothetical protein